MIDRNEIDNMSKILGVHTSYVQRDYVHGWLLSLLYSSSILSDKLILKGGNCLRKGYFENSRYSRDIDFTTSFGISDEELSKELNAICEIANKRSGVTFDLSKTRVEDKKRVDSEKKISEARLYFKDFYGKENELVLGVKLDVTQFDKIYLPVQERYLIHPYSDYKECSAKIKCVKLEELLATKMRCLLQRKHIADLYDLVYATMINGDIEIDRAQLISTFYKITIFGSQPSVAKGLFIDLPIEALGRFWSQYISCPVKSWFDFDKAKESFFELIHILIPGREERFHSSVFFPSKLRNPILEAADSFTMLKLTYDYVERLVEPYELAFKIRKDGIAREYFYAYDTIGGRSSGPGLKTFVSDKIQAIENTDKKYEPRYEVEICKAGGSENISRFEGKRRLRIGNLITNTPIRRRLSKTRKYSNHSFGIEYQIECPYCNKRFKRKNMDTKLNPHKDKYGNPCYGKVGYIVY